YLSKTQLKNSTKVMKGNLKELFVRKNLLLDKIACASLSLSLSKYNT
ncbi:MAG: hypothetical protein ACJAXH_001821, partial [Colwellia sp.]